MLEIILNFDFVTSSRVPTPSKYGRTKKEKDFLKKEGQQKYGPIITKTVSACNLYIGIIVMTKYSS